MIICFVNSLQPKIIVFWGTGSSAFPSANKDWLTLAEVSFGIEIPSSSAIKIILSESRIFVVVGGFKSGLSLRVSPITVDLGNNKFNSPKFFPTRPEIFST